MRTESLDLSLASVAGSRMADELSSAARNVYPPRMPPPSSARSEGEEGGGKEDDPLFPSNHKPTHHASASARASRPAAEEVVPVLSDQERTARLLSDAMMVGDRLPFHTTPHQRDALRRVAAPPTPLLQELYARPGATAAVIAVVAAAAGYALAKQEAGRAEGGGGGSFGGPSVPCSAAVDRMLRYA